MSDVNSALSYLNNSIDTFSSNVDVHVQNVDVSSRNVQAAAQDTLTRVQQFKTTVMQGETKQIAHENIMRIDQIIKEQFGNYDAIRKTIIGVVRDFDINLVRNSTIEELSEELWITSSRYWLSYALLAVTAWVNNYPDVARNALAESGRKDAIKTSLFFCLLNLRFQRITTAREWFKVYCKALDPTMLQQETSVMVQGFMNGVFGKDKQLEHEVSEIINEWLRIISENAEISQELMDSYEKYFETTAAKAEVQYDMILRHCTNAREVTLSCVDVARYDKLIALVEELSVDGVMRTDDNYKARIDAVLTNLITNYDDEEQELKNQQQRYKYIVEHDGDEAAADAQYAAFVENQNESYNIGKQMLGWVVYTDSEETDVQIRKFGLQSTKNWFLAALESWSSKVKERCPLQFPLSIDAWHGVTDGDDLEEQRTNMKNFFENNKFKMICVNTFNIALLIAFFVSLIITVASIVSCINSGFTVALIVGIVLMLASAGILALRILSGKKKFEQRVNQALSDLEGTLVQIAEFRRFFNEGLKKKDDVVAKLSYI